MYLQIVILGCINLYQEKKNRIVSNKNDTEQQILKTKFVGNFELRWEKTAIIDF
jgi:hypothetical protein